MEAKNFFLFPLYVLPVQTHVHGHSGAGNEAADALAKAGAKK